LDHLIKDVNGEQATEGKRKRKSLAAKGSLEAKNGPEPLSNLLRIITLAAIRSFFQKNLASVNLNHGFGQG